MTRLADDDPSTSTRIDGRARRSSRPIAAPDPEGELPPLSHAETELLPGTVAEVVDRDVRRRILSFAQFTIALVVFGSVSSIFLGGDRFARGVLFLCMIPPLLAASWIWKRLLQKDYVSTTELVVFGTTCAIGVSGGFYYWGLLSGALVLLPLGVFVFPVVNSRLGLLASALYLSTHAILTVLTISGVLEDRGLVQPVALSVTGQYLCLLLVDLVAASAYLIGRQTQFSAQRALLDLEHATREAAQRGDLLAEARADLARALRAGKAGRFTGQTVGSLRLGPLLGRGAMGEVYEASREDGASVAVKLLHPQLVADRAYYARFVREARIAASLQVENVVRVLDASEDDAVLPYLVMERLHGKNLAEHLAQVTRMSEHDVVEMVRQVGRGLDAAHEAGVVHRDLKPQNVYRAEQGKHIVWKVLDFGVSKLLEHTGTLSQGVVVGTPQYMAPEQARGDFVDGRADLYALSLLAYRALTGRPPFVVSDLRALLAITETRMPLRPSSVAPLAKELDDVLAVGMAKEPRERFATADEFAEALLRAVRGDVPSALKQRAHSVLRKHPWGDPARTEGPRPREESAGVVPGNRPFP